MTLHFVVNGEDVVVDILATATLDAARDLALIQSHNAARPPEDWELREENGTLIADLSQSINTYGFDAQTHLYVTLQVGWSG